MDDFARAQIQALQRRVDDLEHHMRMVYEHAGLDTSALHRDAPAVDPQLVEMLRAGRMVQAIKVYADQNGVDLMTAKQAIERIHAEGNF
jgi:hypothetical protein